MRGLGRTGTKLVLKILINLERLDSFDIDRVEDKVSSWVK